MSSDKYVMTYFCLFVLILQATSQLTTYILVYKRSLAYKLKSKRFNQFRYLAELKRRFQEGTNLFKNKFLSRSLISIFYEKIPSARKLGLYALSNMHVESQLQFR